MTLATYRTSAPTGARGPTQNTSGVHLPSVVIEHPLTPLALVVIGHPLTPLALVVIEHPLTPLAWCRGPHQNRSRIHLHVVVIEHSFNLLDVCARGGGGNHVSHAAYTKG